MSGPNFGRNPALTCHEVNSQKTLIYDLRSQLSNLKNQFSRLISKPSENASKSKIEPRPITKSRYSCVESDGEQDSQISNNSFTQLPKSSEISPRLNFIRTETTLGGKNGQTFQRFSQNYRKNSNQQSLNTQDVPVSAETQKKGVDSRKVDVEGVGAPLPKKTQEFGAFYKKFHGSAYELGDKANISSKVSNKTTEISSDAPIEEAYMEQLRSTEQKIKRLEEQNHQQLVKINSFHLQVQDLLKKSTGMQKEIHQLNSQNARKDQRIMKLEEQIREVTQKAGKANEQTMEIGREKAREMDLIRQGHANQLKNQQKDFQKRMAAQKQNFQIKYEGQVNAIKSSYEAKLVQQGQEIQKLKAELNSSNQKAQRARLDLLAEVEKGRAVREGDLREKTCEINRQREKIAVLEARQAQFQKTLGQKLKSSECKQMGINTQQKPVPKQPQGPQAQPPSSQPDPQTKSLQDKLTIYLNNIDKQSQKLKQQKSQLQKSQRALQQCNRIICEKESAIRNLMRDCKAMEKDLGENRRVRKELEVLLEEANRAVGLMWMRKLNGKYQGV